MDDPVTGGSLFSGIGGLDLGLERAGVNILWQCEIDSYCRRILNKHWPNTPCYEDVRLLDATTPKVDILFGGFPCQPVSSAGRRQAEADPRWLWPEFARVIGVLRPHYVLVENVPGLLTKGMGFVLADLSSLGYDAEWHCLAAASFGAPHRRERIILVAYHDGASRPQQERQRQVMGASEEFAGDGEDGALANADGSKLREESICFGGIGGTSGAGDNGSEGALANASEAGQQDVQGSAAHGILDWRRGLSRNGGTEGGYSQWRLEPDVGRVAHGVPARVDRLRGLGNAVVPQVAEYIGRMIVQARH